MVVGMINEQVTVVAPTPVLDRKKTSVGLNVTRDILQALPSARDPWDIINMTPGVVMSMDNVGGIDGGQRCIAIITAIQIANGTIVVPISYVVTNPGRLVSGSVVSSDNGQRWQQSTSVDIGQRGDHSGAVEPTIAELRDGRLWMVIRTNLGRFYQAFSEDCGMTWSAPMPTELQSPSAPGYLLRLRSGNLGVMDYLNLKNVAADTDMRKSISEMSTGPEKKDRR